MVQAIDFNRPEYNAVNINIRKPEINKTKDSTDLNDRGIYNSVNLGIDNPAVNTGVEKIYNYPESNGIVTYDMINAQNAPIPQFYPIHASYEASAIIIPDDVEKDGEFADVEDKLNNDKAIENDEKQDVPVENYTTLEAEKDNKLNLSNDEEQVSFHGSEDAVKAPEIIPSEEIMPEVDIAGTVSNLQNDDFDVQALQMEDMVKIADDKEKVKEYLVSDVFSSLIDIAEKNTDDLEGPSKEQEDIRRKIMANFLEVQTNKNNAKLPYEVTEEEVNLATLLSPKELAERNKEYALITMAMLDKVYIEDIEEKNGNVVALTDIPGISSMVDAVKTSKNPTIKVAAIDSLRYIARPEYKNELSEIFNIAQNDENPAVSEVAAYSLNKINQN